MIKVSLVAAGAALLLALEGALPAGSPSASPSPSQGATARMLGGVTHGSVALPTASTQRHGASPFQLEPISRLGRVAPPKPGTPLFRGGVRPKSSATQAAAGPHAPVSAASTSIALLGGLNRPGIAASANSQQITPPDSTGAVGPNNYVEMANSIIHVWDRSLNSVASTDFSTFVGITDPWCDPQVQWDPTAGRWLFVILLCNGTSATPQGFVIGWSRTSDPSALSRSGWCDYGIGTGTRLFDYPKLGHNTKYLIVGGNFYDLGISLSNPPFVGAAMGWLTLPANGDTTCPSETFNGTSSALVNGDGTTTTFTPVPVNTDSGAGNGYIVSAYDPSGSNNGAPGPKHFLAVWHLDSAGVLHQDSDITVSTYSAPPAAAQLGTSDVLDTLDGRLTQAVGDPTTGIWTQHTVLNGGVSKVTWYELALSGPALTLIQEGDVTGVSGEYIFDAAISPSYNSHGAAIFYARSSTSIHPLIGARLRTTSTPLGTMLPGELVLASSSAADTDFSCIASGGGPPCRWGDYSAATPDPVQPNAVWGTNEFNTASGSMPAWQNENFAVLIYAPPSAPTNVSAIPGDSRACVYWTASGANDGGFPDLSYKIREYVAGVLQTTIIVGAPAFGVCVSGLTNGTQYTFTAAAIDAAGESAESAPTNPLTPTRAPAQSSPGSPPARSPVDQAPPGTPAPR